MLALRAVDPHGGRAVDHDGVGGRGGRGGGDGHEARVEASRVGVQRDGLARLVEGRLRDGVVGGCELELHHVALGGDEVVGEVGERAVGGADADNVDGD